MCTRQFCDITTSLEANHDPICSENLNPPVHLDWLYSEVSSSYTLETNICTLLYHGFNIYHELFVAKSHQIQIIVSS